MKVALLAIGFCFVSIMVSAQVTVFEQSNGTESATYFQAIEYYKQLDKASPKVTMKTMGPTDAAYPLHLVLVSADGSADPVAWHRQHKAVILVINGIHPGEPDGIDASMMLVRDLVAGKVKLPQNVALGIIPVYNIGGSLNRGTSSRVNQNGPKEYGFRGNSQNLDLNRDFTKIDSYNSQSFAQLFHWLNPDIQIDNHVSDGADYQYTMTMLTTQPDKLGGELGQWLRNSFEPSLYSGMASKKWEMTPYVNFETADFKKGMEGFYDPPRYSSGYAALWQTIAFVPETHMLKPYKDRVLSTYAFMQTVIEEASKQADSLLALRSQATRQMMTATRLPLAWKVDSSNYALINFKGYEPEQKTSAVTGLPRLFYNHDKPFTRSMPYYNSFVAYDYVNVPDYYLVPHGWHSVIDRLKWNNVTVKQLQQDTTITLDVIKISSVKTMATPYEKHYRKTSVAFDTVKQTIRFLKGDYLVTTNQPAKRFIVEMLEPAGNDSYFAWNFFDAVLQQKEWYSDYRWEDVAADLLKNDPSLKAAFDLQKQADSAFASNAGAQLRWLYLNSKYYEPAHNRYPVYRLFK